MNETPDIPDIDPTVEAHLDSVVGKMTEDSVPSKTFGDEVIVGGDSVRAGETPEQAHIRLQEERRIELSD